MSGRRANQSGSVYRKGNGWEGRVADETGRYRYVSAPTKREATAKLATLVQRLRSGQPARDSNVTFAAYVTEWVAGPLADSGRAPSTVALYASLLTGHAVPVLGTKTLATIKPRDIEITLAKATKTMAASSVRSLAYAIKALFATAVRDRLVAVIPMAGVHIPTARAKEAQHLDADELAKVLHSATDEPLYPLWLFAAMTGCRRGEMLGLRWSLVDLEQGIARIAANRTRVAGKGLIDGPTKNRQNRTVPLPPPLVAELKRYRTRQRADKMAAGDAYTDTGLVFVSDLGTGLDPRMVTRRARQLLERNGLSGEGLGPHLFRHSVSALLLSESHAATAVSELLGHSTVAVTLSTYAHVVRKDRTAITTALGGIIGA